MGITVNEHEPYMPPAMRAGGGVWVEQSAAYFHPEPGGQEPEETDLEVTAPMPAYRPERL